MQTSMAIKWSEELGLPNVSAILYIIATLPVSSCEAERAFSKLAYIKDEYRTTMSHER